jgi:hypothetical protein
MNKGESHHESLLLLFRELTKFLFTMAFPYAQISRRYNSQARGAPLRQLSETAHSILLQMSSISGGRLPNPRPEDAPRRVSMRQI